MSWQLFHLFLQDDVDAFSRLLAGATLTSSAAATAHPPKNSSAIVTGSSLSYGSPNAFSKHRKGSSSSGPPPAFSLAERSVFGGTTLTRSEINAKDRYGRTLMHLIASSEKKTAYAFASALLAVPATFLDTYVQDVESGWTCLHRALYAGNISIAQAIMDRDSNLGITGGLIKVKDREGNSPFEVYSSSVMHENTRDTERGQDPGEDDESAVSEEDLDEHHYGVVKPAVARFSLDGDELYTFGSNKNLSLGVGDSDDRQFPERILLPRPNALLRRFYEEKYESEDQGQISEAAAAAVEELPFLIRSTPTIVQDVVMSKLHTAFITTDPCSNLYMCGFGPGGRLGTGLEATSFSPVCIDSGAIAGKRITAVALGLDHTIAISDQGEVFSWGSNKHNQLGYALPKPKHSTGNSVIDVPTQLTPRQIFNPFKRDRILGAAASPIHSVVFTSSALYTFGRNDGQLGLMDADARSLTSQPIPRKVGASLFNVSISSVAAIERATVVLLENHEVWVFTHYGYSKLVFPPSGSVSSFIQNSFMAKRHGDGMTRITKIRAGGKTICALSSGGEVFTVSVPGQTEEDLDRESRAISMSTTNPAKIRNSLPQPTRVWAVKKSRMAVCDVDVGQDGSIILCTQAGSAWVKERRVGIKPTPAGVAAGKEFKFVRVPSISRAVGVRSNAFGAYSVIQRSSDAAKQGVIIDKQRLWDDIRPLLPFGGLVEVTGDGLGRVDIVGSKPHLAKDRHSEAKVDVDVEKEWDALIDAKMVSLSLSGPSIAWLSTTLSDKRIPVHEFMLAARSPILRNALSTFRRQYYFSLPGIMSIEYDKEGQVHLSFTGVTFLSLFNLAIYLYTDRLYDVWIRYRHDKKQANAALYRQVRADVIKLATTLEMSALERATRNMILPSPSLHTDMASAIQDTPESSIFDTADVVIELDEDVEVKAHSHILYNRCPFFDGLFRGRAGGRWLSPRLAGQEREAPELIRVDLTHIEPKVWTFVMRFIYADVDKELFEDVRVPDGDAFMDLVIDVLSVANELMIDRLAQVCQQRLSMFVTTHNVCQLLNAVMPCSVTDFKHAALEFICLNLEVMLENRLLDGLDPDLLLELDKVCQENQMNSHPVSRGRNAGSFLAERYPDVLPLVEQDKRRRIDAMRLRSHLHEDEVRDTLLRPGSLEKERSPLTRRGKQAGAASQSSDKPGSEASPTLVPKRSVGDFIFQMDDEFSLRPESRRPESSRQTPSGGSSRGSPRTQPQPSTPSYGPTLGLDLGPATFPQLSAKSSYTGLRTSAPPSTPKTIPYRPSTSSRDFNSSITPNSPPPKAPWCSITPTTTRSGLKDIMAETSNPHSPPARVDGISRTDIEATRNFTPKLSQKERKKLKQQQLAAEQEPAKPGTSSSSIWQIAQSPKLTPTKIEPNLAPPTTMRSTPKSSLTLRQTVAGSGIAGSLSPHLKPTVPKTPPRAVSRPVDFSTAVAKTPAAFSSSGTGTSQISLATILLQQQIEKDEIHEAATAKHNLHDIQVEQEFQQWWDQETQRVMQEEQAAEAKAKVEGEKVRSKKTAATRGASRGRGRGGIQQRSQASRNDGGQHPQQISAGTSATVNSIETAPARRSVSDSHTDDRKRQTDRARGRLRGGLTRRGGAASTPNVS